MFAEMLANQLQDRSLTRAWAAGEHDPLLRMRVPTFTIGSHKVLDSSVHLHSYEAVEFLGVMPQRLGRLPQHGDVPCAAVLLELTFGKHQLLKRVL